MQELELCGGLDTLENLQMHDNHIIYTKAVSTVFVVSGTLTPHDHVLTRQRALYRLPC